MQGFIYISKRVIKKQRLLKRVKVGMTCKRDVFINNMNTINLRKQLHEDIIQKSVWALMPDRCDHLSQNERCYKVL